MVRVNFFLLFACVASLVLAHEAASDPEKSDIVNIILVGATGDLAKKYLWQALFTLFINNAQTSDPVALRFIGAAREPYDAGKKKVEDAVMDSLDCFAPDVKAKLSDLQCLNFVMQFTESWDYEQVKTREHYQALGDRLSKDTKFVEKGRLFYLSVPPFAYEGIARNIHEVSRPATGWLRVVLEKPFGEDLQSAQLLAKNLGQFLQEDEMYRVDHYLGKPGVTAIEEFRYANRQLDSIWNLNFIERVDIVMKETDDVKGRTKFYDAYGVIRDVHQNHLTQIMILVAMELATETQYQNRTFVQQLKDNVLRDSRILQGPSVVTGQYDTYLDHVKADDASKTASDTPTYAAAVAFVDNHRWKGVPFCLVGGKNLDERSAFVKVHFKASKLCLSEFCPNQEVLFHIQGGSIKDPAVLLSKSFDNINTDLLGSKPLPKDLSIKYNGAMLRKGDAYTKLVAAVFYGERDRFVGTDNLLKSWEMWTPLLGSSKKPRQYSLGGYNLNAVIDGNKMRFSDTEEAQVDGTCSASRVKEGARFRGASMFTGPASDLIAELANKMVKQATAAVKSNGVFHMAVSGGSSPNQLFQFLAFFEPTFPWASTHVWQVDERCVASSDQKRNFAALQANLFANLPVYLPHSNIHPMPVELQSGFCVAADKGTDLYFTELKNHGIIRNKFDFVLLGIGEDGHTASLFPGQASIKARGLVTLADAPEETGATKRMTLTFRIINEATEVAVLVVGSRKKDIVAKLQEATMDKPIEDVFPVTGVRWKDTTWYIDSDAF
eukprot:CAMPEP_0175145562 /NCGR_PEP_ID=MMETSP0087-20121206/14848_1 /TAXON_ID=136419 /ORGANISM="Unknown Unknown, Strain D1" /LENGTH=776 /DNA_ID=CAMNT_0016430339 /DNA_START=8 /DNA_END=2338 /DNA_ORIENTATION=-